jgi:hypothetical protein
VPSGYEGETRTIRGQEIARGLLDIRAKSMGRWPRWASMIQLFQRLEIPSLDAISETYVNGKRWYLTPAGKYASLTTVLAFGKDETALKAWRERVGEEEAERISSESRDTGTDMHSAIERFLEGESLCSTSERCRLLLRTMLPALARIDRIRHLEVPLYSDEFRIAGRCDCIADFNGTLSIIDFKNSLRPKRREWIGDYLLQVVGYAKMYEERSGTPVSQGVVLIATPDASLQTFTAGTIGLTPVLRNRIERFYAQSSQPIEGAA